MNRHLSKSQSNRKDDNPPFPDDYQMYMDERMSKKKKKLVIRTAPRSGSPFTSPTFEMPTSDKTGRFLPAPTESVRSPQKCSENKYGQPTDPRREIYDPKGQNVNQPNSSKYETEEPIKSNPYEQNVYHQPKSSKYDTNTPSKNRPDNQGNIQYRDQRQNQVSYTQPMYTNYKQIPIKPEPTSFDLSESPSLICRAVNYEGEPVKVNDEIIEDKLILSCRPRAFYGLGGYSKKPRLVDSDRGPKYPYAPPQINVIDNNNINRPTDTDVRQQYREPVDDREPREKEKMPLERSDARDLGSLGLGDGGLEQTQLQAQTAKYEEQYRIMQCKKYTRNFRGFLWALFIINILLLLTGLTIMLICLYQLIFRDYINMVLAYTGFVIWVWVALALSLIIIAVAVYGIITAVTRRKRMIQFWILCAIVAIVLIFIFLLVYWLMHSDMKEVQEKSMSKTFHVYRCSRYVRFAWDTLHEQYQCCGIENRAEWKYIPQSCCNSESKYTKLKCINHFIPYEMAYKNGCRSLLEEYFTTLFLLITVLLVIAIILLFLGIIVAWRLLKMYKVILLCRDTYSITS